MAASSCNISEMVSEESEKKDADDDATKAKRIAESDCSWIHQIHIPFSFFFAHKLFIITN